MDMTQKTSTEEYQEWLLSYYFGTLEEPERGQLEQQLMLSPDLLGKFVTLKRMVELGDTQTTPRPSEKAKSQLRRAVAQRFQPRLYTRAWKWLRQPIPLYQGLVVVLGLLLLLTLATPPHQTRAIKPGPLIDSASTGSEQLRWN